jgi:hypothetical protein
MATAPDLNAFFEDLILEFFPIFVGMSLGVIILAICLGILISVFVMGFLVRFACYLRKVPTTFARTLGTAFYMLLCGLASFIPFVGIIITIGLQLYVIHRRHFVEWLDAFLIWLFALVIPVAIVLLILASTGMIQILV